MTVWQHFQNRADTIKAAMFQSVTWTVGFAAGVLGFIFAKLVAFADTGVSLVSPVAVLLAAMVGLVLCLYAAYLLSESAHHIRSNWDRADEAKKGVEGLDRIIRAGDRDRTGGLAKLLGAIRRKEVKIMVWHRLGVVVVLFAIAFVTVAAWGIGSWNE